MKKCEVIMAPRSSGKIGDTGTYHIILRGTGCQEIFHDEEDNMRFVEILSKYKKECEYQIYAWCLMRDHIHIVIKEGKEELARTMKRIAVSYAWHYNWKYKTTGHLFQDKFWSEDIENDEYLLTVVRYIHHNPVKAEIVAEPSQWDWSSCKQYYGQGRKELELVDEQTVFDIFSSNRQIAVSQFREFNESKDVTECKEVDTRDRLTDDIARDEIIKVLSGKQIASVKSLPKKERDLLICRAKAIDNISLRQVARILGVSLMVVYRA